jgi:hypothetical protein
MLAAQQARMRNESTSEGFAERNLGLARGKSILSAGERFWTSTARATAKFR